MRGESAKVYGGNFGTYFLFETQNKNNRGTSSGKGNYITFVMTASLQVVGELFVSVYVGSAKYIWGKDYQEPVAEETSGKLHASVQTSFIGIKKRHISINITRSRTYGLNVNSFEVHHCLTFRRRKKIIVHLLLIPYIF